MRWPLMLKKTHDACCDAWLALANDLESKYERVQYGYDQGILEGKRQGYINVRASLADLAYNAPLLRGPLTQILSDLGTEESKLLVEMKSHKNEEN